jgi:hypothetical protein
MWIPTSNVTEHDGSTIDPSLDFFALTPPEIGRVLSVHSSLKKSKKPSPFSSFLPGLRHYCTYIGEQGIAKLTIAGSRDQLHGKEVVEFKNATDLGASRQINYTNGIYSGTGYLFRWCDKNGTVLVYMDGSYFNPKGLPETKNPYHFLAAAETLWHAFIRDRLVSELKTRGSIRFRLFSIAGLSSGLLTPKDYIEIGPVYVEINKQGHCERLTAENLRMARVGNGKVRFERLDAKSNLLGSRGVYELFCAEISNYRSFDDIITNLLNVKTLDIDA